MRRAAITPIGPSIAYVPLTQKQYALIDAEDAGEIGQYVWCAAYSKSTRSFYAVRYRNIKLHSSILSPSAGLVTDHINGNTLDNRRSNLREVTERQNSINRRCGRSNKTGRKGVYWAQQSRKWQATIRIMGKNTHLGYFTDIDEAHAAYLRAAEAYHGEFRRSA